MIINDHDWILLYYTNEEQLFLENTDREHFIKSAKAILDRSVHIVYYTFSDTGFYLLLHIEQAKKIVGRAWRVKTNLYVSVKDLFVKICDHYNTTIGTLIDSEQLQVCKILSANWILGVNEEEKNKVTDSIIYMNRIGKKYQQSDFNYLYKTLQIDSNYIDSRNQELHTNKFQKYIIQQSKEFSNITI